MARLLQLAAPLFSFKFATDCGIAGQQANNSTGADETNVPDDSSESGETDPDGTLRFILDPDLFVHAPQEYSMLKRVERPRPLLPNERSHPFETRANMDSRIIERWPAKASTSRPQRTSRSQRRSQTSEFDIGIIPRLSPSSPQASREYALNSCYDNRISLSSTGSNTTCCANDESPLMCQLSEAQRVKTRTFARFYRLQYSFRFTPLPTVMPSSFEDMCYHQVTLGEAKKELESSRRYHAWREDKKDAEKKRVYVEEMFSWYVGTALSCARRRMDERAEKAGRRDLATGWSEECLRHKAFRSEVATKQREDQAKAAGMLEVGDYTWRSAKARKAWLERAGGTMKSDDTVKLERQEFMKARDCAARTLHSETSEEELMKLHLPSFPPQETATARPARMSLYAKDYLNRTASLPASMKAESNGDACSDMGSDVYSVYSEHPDGLQGSASSLGAKIVTMARASSKPSMYTLKKASLSADTIRPEA